MDAVDDGGHHNPPFKILILFHPALHFFILLTIVSRVETIRFGTRECCIMCPYIFRFIDDALKLLGPGILWACASVCLDYFSPKLCKPDNS